MRALVSTVNINYIKSMSVLFEAALYRQNKKNSVFGILWPLLQPFTQITIIALVFSYLLNVSNEKMVVNLVASLPFWNLITTVSSNSPISLIIRRDIIKKVKLNRTLLPVTDVLVFFHSCMISFLAMYLALILLYPANFSFSILLIPIVLIPLIISSIVVGIALSYICPYLQDLPQITTLILNTLYWGMPIIYPYSLIPDNKKWLFELNPLFHLLRPMQLLIEIKAWPGNIIMLKAFIVAGIFTVLSYYIHRKLSRNVIFYL